MNKPFNLEFVPLLYKAFSKKILKEILSHGRSEVFTNLIKYSCISIDSEITYSELYDNFYQQLKKYYPNEYVYKNEFLIELLKRNHKKDYTILQEVQVFNSIVDLVTISNQITAYEIKTEYDTLQRLTNQINDYSKVFNKIVIICSEKHLEKVELLVNKNFNYVGIKVFTKNKKIINIKNAKKNPNCSNKYWHEIINYSELKKLNLTKDDIKIYDKIHSFKILKQILINRKKNGQYLSLDCPKSLKSLLMNTHLVEWQREKFNIKINKKIYS